MMPFSLECPESFQSLFAYSCSLSLAALASSRPYDVHRPKSSCFVNAPSCFPLLAPASLLPAGVRLPPTLPGGDMRPEDPIPGVASLPDAERATIRCFNLLMCCSRSRQLLGNSLSTSLVCQHWAKTLALMASTRTNFGSWAAEITFGSAAGLILGKPGLDTT